MRNTYYFLVKPKEYNNDSCCLPPARADCRRRVYGRQELRNICAPHCVSTIIHALPITYRVMKKCYPSRSTCIIHAKQTGYDICLHPLRANAASTLCNNASACAYTLLNSKYIQHVPSAQLACTQIRAHTAYSIDTIFIQLSMHVFTKCACTERVHYRRDGRRRIYSAETA